MSAFQAIENTTRRRCKICGDVAYHRHFGALACGSCKSFFLRCIRRGRVEKCRHNGKCVVSMETRSTCQRCRYDKCRAVGMHPERVHFREELTCVARPPQANPQEFLNRLTEKEYYLILDLVKAFKKVVCVKPIPFQNAGNTELLLATQLRAIDFASTIPDLCDVTDDERTILVRSSIFRQTWLGYAIVTSNIVSSQKKKCSNFFLRYHPKGVMRNNSAERVDFLTHMANLLSEVPLDEPMITIITTAMYFITDAPGLRNVKEVARIQMKYLSILLKYIQWKRGTTHSAVIYPKLMHILFEFARTMSHSYVRPDHHVWLEKDELDELNEKLGEFSPYRHYSIQERDYGFKPCFYDNAGLDSHQLSTLSVDAELLKFLNITKEDCQVPISTAEGAESLFDLIASLDDIA